MLVLIGPRWVTAELADGRRRLDDPDDHVVAEIAAALDHDIRIIPVLVEGTSMPPASALPERIRGLTRRNGVRLSTVSWSPDLEALLATLRKLSPAGDDQETSPVEDRPAVGARLAGPQPSDALTRIARRSWPRTRRCLGALAVAVVGIIVFFLPGDQTEDVEPRPPSDAALSVTPASGPGGTRIDVSAPRAPSFLPEGEWEECQLVSPARTARSPMSTSRSPPIGPGRASSASPTTLHQARPGYGPSAGRWTRQTRTRPGRNTTCARRSSSRFDNAETPCERARSTWEGEPNPSDRVKASRSLVTSVTFPAVAGCCAGLSSTRRTSFALQPAPSDTVRGRPHRPETPAARYWRHHISASIRPNEDPLSAKSPAVGIRRRDRLHGQ
jgi:hypothetical protein